VTHLFLDVETYSPGPRSTHDDKVIAIAYKQEGGPVTVLKAWRAQEARGLNGGQRGGGLAINIILAIPAFNIYQIMEVI